MSQNSINKEALAAGKHKEIERQQAIRGLNHNPVFNTVIQWQPTKKSKPTVSISYTILQYHNEGSNH